MAKTNNIDWPTVFGDKRVILWNHAGPSSYAAVVNGSPATGGDPITQGTLQAQGMKAGDLLTAPMTSDDGQFIVQAIPVTGNTAASAGVTPSFGSLATTVVFRLRWLVAATGAEVAPATDLHLRTIKLMGVGPK